MGTFDPVRGVYRSNGGKFTERGSSDILGIYRGKMLCIEVKSKTGRLRPEQESFLNQMERLGAIAGMVRSLDQAIELIKRYFPAVPQQIPDLSDARV